MSSYRAKSSERVLAHDQLVSRLSYIKCSFSTHFFTSRNKIRVDLEWLTSLELYLQPQPPLLQSNHSFYFLQRVDDGLCLFTDPSFFFSFPYVFGQLSGFVCLYILHMFSLNPWQSCCRFCSNIYGLVVDCHDLSSQLMAKSSRTCMWW